MEDRNDDDANYFTSVLLWSICCNISHLDSRIINAAAPSSVARDSQSEEQETLNQTTVVRFTTNLLHGKISTFLSRTSSSSRHCTGSVLLQFHEISLKFCSLSSYLPANTNALQRHH